MEQYFDAGFDVCLHDNYEFSTASPISQISSKAPKIKTIFELLAVAQELDLQVLSESENARTERVEVTSGASSRVSILKLKRDIAEAPLVSQASSKGQFAISKHIPKGEIDDESKRYDALIRELLILSHPPVASHHNIVNLLALGWEDSEDKTMHKIWPTTILEYAEYGTLKDFFDFEDTDTSWDIKLSICRDIATGLSWLHGCSIVHSDLKLLNILIAKADPGAATSYQAKICDFGYALDLDVLVASGSNTATLEGYSPPWCAPEYASEIEIPLLPRVDVCGFGLLACRIFMNGADPFQASYRPATLQPTDSYTRHIKTWWANDQITFLLKHACHVIGLSTPEQLNTIYSVLERTTCLEAKNRVTMSEVCDILEAETTDEGLGVIEYENGVESCPDLEKYWASGLPKQVQRTIIEELHAYADVLSQSLVQDDLQLIEAASNATYQLSIVYEIGFGCDLSEIKALEYLLSSAFSGNPEARKEVYGTFCALSRPFPPEYISQLALWLHDEALKGEKVCLEELGVISSELYNTVETSPVRSRKLCERSGIIFDESFFDLNDLGDIPGLLSAIQESHEEIDCDIGGGMTWLHYAAYGGSFEFAVRLVVDCRAPLNARNIKSQTPLWIACLGGNFDIAKFLMEQGADVSIASSHGVTPLHSLPAFQDNCVPEIATILIRHGAEVNAQATGGLTPLHYAVRGSGATREEPAVAILLLHEANPLITDDDGETPIEAAIVTMRPVYLKHMLCSEHVANMEPTKVARLLANCFQSFIGQMRFHRLRQGGVQYSTKVRELVRTLHTKDIVSVYIANHVAGYSPLHDASRWSFDIAQEILLLGQDASHINLVPEKGHGYTPLMLALRNSDLESVDRLIRAGADPLRRARCGENALHVCVEYNHTLVPWLCDNIANKADLIILLNEATPEKGETPLDYALMLGHIPTASFLIAQGADPRHFHGGLDMEDQFNSLESCLKPPNIPGLKMLLSLPDPPDVVSSTSGYTLLHHTCAYIYDEAKPGDISILHFLNTLLDYFPERVNSTGGSQSITPMHIAAFLGNTTAAKILHSRGADVTIADINGKTPRDYLLDRIETGDEGRVGLAKRTFDQRLRELKACLYNWNSSWS